MQLSYQYRMFSWFPKVLPNIWAFLKFLGIARVLISMFKKCLKKLVDDFKLHFYNVQTLIFSLKE